MDIVIIVGIAVVPDNLFEVDIEGRRDITAVVQMASGDIAASMMDLIVATAMTKAA
ncbi:hypothetical protein [Methylobacterium brachythecii]|uniref:Uncharacterized protein n=1 Tax=Methylobacterium brachythecii TaxID=1176177 RepID=A0A7W6AIL3_9HYPH|nr:hypothetical protein [Methylobacterium brachythecii]MBB3902085.1 hypothetical protein [Methylobacterium brachythecii]GLS44482.1 hypothetical protein GCM10007884_24700 [Methylobacterium brachythecii]